MGDFGLVLVLFLCLLSGLAPLNKILIFGSSVKQWVQVSLRQDGGGVLKLFTKLLEAAVLVDEPGRRESVKSWYITGLLNIFVIMGLRSPTKDIGFFSSKGKLLKS